MTEVYLSLGSNVGDREANLAQAVRSIETGGVYDTRLSSLYETEPVGLRDQPWFLNAVCAGQTSLPPLCLLHLLQNIESKMGRVRTVRWGPRCIDVDILLYGDLILDSPRLTIPHPRMAERAFVLVPLVEIAPAAWHPGLESTARDLLNRLPSAAEVHYWGRLKEKDVPEECT
jgi:2-amino-4-hydroxy-6-hydroxymethyldihydropteridine diphosphokinase